MSCFGWSHFGPGGSVANSAVAKPPVPSKVKVTETKYESFTFSWNASKGATSYTVKIAADAAFKKDVKTFGTRSTKYKPIKLRNCTTYYYKVLANNGSKSKSSYSKAQKVTLDCFWPGTFSKIKATPKSASSIELSWTRPSNATRFVVWRSSDKSFASGVKKFTTSSTKIIDTGLVGGKSYYYRVYAFNKANKVNVRQAPRVEGNVATAKPEGLKVTAVSAFGATAQWNRAQNARTYELSVATNSTFTANAKTYKTTTSRNAIKINSLKPDTKYYFRVRSLNGLEQNIAKSAYSTPVSATVGHPAVDINAMSFNVRTVSADTTAPESQRWSSRRGAVVATVQNQQIDLLGAQEAYATRVNAESDSDPQWEDLRKRLGKVGYERAKLGPTACTTTNNAGEPSAGKTNICWTATTSSTRRPR